jgi:hypothetical protein
MLLANDTTIGQLRYTSEASSCSVTEGPPIVHLQRRIVSLTPEQDETSASLSMLPLLRPLCLDAVNPWNDCRVFPRPTISYSIHQSVFQDPLVVLSLFLSFGLGCSGRADLEGLSGTTLVCLETCEATRAPDPDAETETIGPAPASPPNLPSSSTPPSPKHNLLSANSLSRSHPGTSAIAHILVLETSVCVGKDRLPHLN